jgi:hypothetical protein
MNLILFLASFLGQLNDNFHFSAYKNIYFTPQHYIEVSTKNWQGHFSAKNFTSNQEKQELISIQNSLSCTLASLPKQHVNLLKSLEIRNKYHVSRGMANSEKIILHIKSIENNKELAAVTIHELAHIVDIGGFKGTPQAGESSFIDGNTPIYNNDLSVLFYKLSWQNTNTKKFRISSRDFVSGYASSDPFEDFAETYLFFRLHGEKFRKIKNRSVVLQQKYDFMQRFVFKREFELNKPVSINTQGIKNNWDTTLLNFNDRDLNYFCSLK